MFEPPEFLEEAESPRREEYVAPKPQRRRAESAEPSQSAPEPPQKSPEPEPPSRPAPARPQEEAGVGDRSFWPSFAAGLRGKVPNSVMPYLNNPAKVTGVWKNGKLTLWVDSEFTRSMLNKPAILEGLAGAAAASFGGKAQVSIVTGAPPKEKKGGGDPLDELLSFGGQFDVPLWLWLIDSTSFARRKVCTVPGI